MIIVDRTDGGSDTGCIQPTFPAGEPDLLVTDRPRFLLTTTQGQQNSAGQAEFAPGQAVDAQITVNAATRQASIELKNAWFDAPPIATQALQTAGGETLDVTLQTAAGQPPGRFYMRITLCGVDCDESTVVFDLDTDINANYARTLLEDREVARVDSTCIGFEAVPDEGSGTVLIQGLDR